MKESKIESRLVQMVRERGGLCYKFVSPGNPGVPDRIVITPGGRTVYVELKTEIGRLAAIQQWQLEEMRKRGADVRVLKGLEQVKAFVEEVFTARSLDRTPTRPMQSAGSCLIHLWRCSWSLVWARP